MLHGTCTTALVYVCLLLHLSQRPLRIDKEKDYREAQVQIFDDTLQLLVKRKLPQDGEFREILSVDPWHHLRVWIAPGIFLICLSLSKDSGEKLVQNEVGFEYRSTERMRIYLNVPLWSPWSPAGRAASNG